MRTSGWIAYGLLGAVFGLGLTTGCSGSSEVITPDGGAGGQGGSGGNSNACATLAFANPQDGAQLTEKDDADGDFCENGFQYTVIISTDADDGTLVNLYSSTGRIGQAAVANGVARFEKISLSQGTETLRAELDGTQCTTEETVSIHCAGRPDCKITQPVITPTHPKLNGVPVTEGGDRVSSDGSPYQVAFKVATTIEDGQPVTLHIDQATEGLTSYAKGGSAEFPAVTLEPGKEHTAMAVCSPKNGPNGMSGEVFYDVDIEPPPLSVQKDLNKGEISDLADGDHFGPNDDADDTNPGLQMRICGTTDKTKAPDALDLKPVQQNFCVGVGTSAPTCTAATSDGGAVGAPGACVNLDCPGAGAFDLKVTLRDAAGNPQVKEFQGITCASKNPQVQLVQPVDSGNPQNPTKLLAAGAAAPNLADQDAGKPGAQYDVVACTSAESGTASLMAGSADGTVPMSEIATASVETDSSNLCQGTTFNHIVKFPTATIPESLEDNDGKLTSATKLEVVVTDKNNGKGTATANLWVDSYAPTISVNSPSPLCGTTLTGTQSQPAVVHELYLQTSSVPVHLDVILGGNVTFSADTSNLLGGNLVLFTDVTLTPGDNLLRASAAEPSGNVGELSNCKIHVGNPPVITWEGPTPSSKLAASTTAGTGIIPDSDVVSPGWQGQLRVKVTPFLYQQGSPPKTTTVTFTSSVNGQLGQGSVEVDSQGYAVLNNVDLSENSATTLTATATYNGETGVSSITVPVDVTPPNAPTGLVATILDRRNTSFHLAWQAPDDSSKPVDSYVIKYSTSNIDTPEKFAQASLIPYTGKPAAPNQQDSIDVPNLLIEREYFFAVQSVDAAGNKSGYLSSSGITAHFNTFAISGQPGEAIGSSLDGSGSVNGDAFSDIIVGATSANRVNLYFGSTQGPSTSPSVKVLGSTSGFGSSVGIVGDVNGDGIGDFAISSPNEGDGGVVYVFKGLADWSSHPTLTTADAMLVITGSSEYSGSLFGNNIRALGDLNGDGIADFMFGAPLALGYDGEAIVVFGQASLGGTISLPNDFGTKALRISGNSASPYSLGTNQLGLGSFYSTPAGRTSLVVSAPYTRGSATCTVYAYHGYTALDNPLGVSHANHEVAGTKGEQLGVTLGLLRPSASPNSLLAVGAPRADGGKGKVFVYGGDSTNGPFLQRTAIITNSQATNKTHFGTGLITSSFSGSGLSSSFIGSSTPDLAVFGTSGNIYIIDGDRITSMGSTTSIDAATKADVTIALPSDWTNSAFWNSGVKDIDGDGYGELLLGEKVTSGAGRFLLLW